MLQPGPEHDAGLWCARLPTGERMGSPCRSVVDRVTLGRVLSPPPALRYANRCWEQPSERDSIECAVLTVFCSSMVAQHRWPTGRQPAVDTVEQTGSIQTEPRASGRHYAMKRFSVSLLTTVFLTTLSEWPKMDHQESSEPSLDNLSARAWVVWNLYSRY